MYKQYYDMDGKTIYAQGIIRLADKVSIPFDPDNTDYIAYLAWVAEGNTPTPADEPTQG